jgi:hypothetical protein
MCKRKLAARKSRSNAAKAVRINRTKKDWNDMLSYFNSVDLGNNKGKVRSFECNKNIVSSIKMALNIFVDLVNDTESNFHVNDLYWSKIDDYIQRNFGLKSGYIQQLRKEFVETGNILVFGGDEDIDKQEIDPPNKKLSKEQAISIIREVDKKHGNGETVSKK